MKQDRPTRACHMTAPADILLLCREPERALALRKNIQANGSHRVVDYSPTAAAVASMVVKHDPDVLVTDLQLADGPVLDLVRRLRTGAGHMHMLILMIAPTPDDPALLDCLRNGADSYYIDHGPGPTLATRIDEMLNGESKMSPDIAQKVYDHFRRQGVMGKPARPMDEVLNPLALTRVEVGVLLRLVQGQTVPEISTAEHLTMHQVAKCVRALYRKMAWDLRTSELSLQLV